MTDNSTDYTNRATDPKAKPSKAQELIDFYENASLKQLGVALLMMCTMTFTTWSVGKGLWPHFGGLSIIIVVALLGALIILSFAAADRLVSKSFFSGIPLLAIAIVFAGIAGAASFNYLYTEASSRTDWISKDAQRAIGGFKKYFIEADNATDEVMASHVTNFKSITSVDNYSQALTKAEEAITKVTQDSTNGQSINEAIINQLKENRQNLTAEISEIPKQLSDVKRDLEDATVDLKLLESNAPEKVPSGVLTDLLQKLELAIDLEHRDPSTSVVRGNKRFVRNPDHARITLHEASDKLPIKISPDACGSLPTEAELQTAGYKGRERLFGKGQNGGGRCTLQLESLTQEIKSYRDRLQQHEVELSEAQQRSDQLQARETELSLLEQNKKRDLNEISSRIENRGEIEPRLVELLGLFLDNPSDASLNKLVEHCDLLVNTAGSLDVLKDTLGQLVCENGGVRAEVVQLNAKRTRYDTIEEICTGDEVDRAFRQQQSGDFSGGTVRAAPNLQAAITELHQNEFSACIDAARDFKVNVADIESKAATYIINNGWSDPLTTEINRYRDVWTLRDTKIGSYTILLVVMIIELSFAVGKITISWLGSGSRLSSDDRSIDISYEVAVALTRKEPVRLPKGKYLLDPDVVSSIADPDLRFRARMLLDDFIEHDMAEEDRRTSSIILFSDAWNKLASVRMRKSSAENAIEYQSINQTISDADNVVPIHNKFKDIDTLQPDQKKKSLSQSTSTNSSSMGGLVPGFAIERAGAETIDEAGGRVSNPFFQDIWLSDGLDENSTS